MTSKPLDLRAELHAFGARAADVVVLDEQRSETGIRYLDLMRVGGDVVRPQAVIEVRGRPTLYVVDGSRGPISELAIKRLLRVLAFRADADHAALLEPGRLTLFPVAPSEALRRTTIACDAPDAPGLIPSIALPMGGATGHRAPVAAATAVHDLLLTLLTRTTEKLTEAGIDHLVALALVGRALFMRFLTDRGVVTDEALQELCGSSIERCFDGPNRAGKTCKWLDDTFNGDFLPLPRGATRWQRELPEVVFHELGDVVRRADADGQHVVWGDSWRDIRFDHIPIGLLSQVYERHAHRFDPRGARQTSVLYTPRHLALYVVDEIFNELGDAAADARVLDPSAGGGVFLVEAFRRIAEARWRVDGRQPGAAELREILYQQLQGFDISEPALRLCTLGLYLTAIELDPRPNLAELRFPGPLMGSVLHDVASPVKGHAYIGSLSDRRLGDRHRHRYDVVLGNPPWSTWESTSETEVAVDEQIAAVAKAIRPTVEQRLGEATAAGYSMVDRVPDVPFVWRAMEWAKPDAHIAFVLHARLLFKQSEPGRVSREELLAALHVTGLLNGAALRMSRFWPDVTAPFCLLFARNRVPPADAAFWYVNPELEGHLNAHGKWRIDDATARRIAPADVAAVPSLLKTLFRGTELDAQLIRRISQFKLVSLQDYWHASGGKDHHGQGFKMGGAGPTTRRKQIDATELWGMHKLEGKRPTTRRIDVASLPKIPRGTKYQHPRKATIYRAPLAIVPETPTAKPGVPNAYLALRDVAYRQSFRGFSCAWHPQPELLARYIFLLFSSELPLYLALLTSGKFGVERDIFEGADLLGFRLRPLELLPESLKMQIVPLSEALCADEAGAAGAVREWIAALYDLSEWDLQVMRDTLAVSLPFAQAKQRAQTRPTGQELAVYTRDVEAIVRSFLARHGREVSLRLLRDHKAEPWILFQLDAHEAGEKKRPLLVAETDALLTTIAEADSLMASRVVIVQPPSRLLLAVSAQYRYFTPSRARLLAPLLVHEHAPILLGDGCCDSGR